MHANFRAVWLLCGASDEAHLNAESAVLTSTLEADKDPVVDGDPLWAGAAALKAHIVLSVT